MCVCVMRLRETLMQMQTHPAHMHRKILSERPYTTSDRLSGLLAKLTAQISLPDAKIRQLRASAINCIRSPNRAVLVQRIAPLWRSNNWLPASKSIGSACQIEYRLQSRMGDNCWDNNLIARFIRLYRRLCGSPKQIRGLTNASERPSTKPGFASPIARWPTDS